MAKRFSNLKPSRRRPRGQFKLVVAYETCLPPNFRQSQLLFGVRRQPADVQQAPATVQASPAGLAVRASPHETMTRRLRVRAGPCAHPSPSRMAACWATDGQSPHGVKRAIIGTVDSGFALARIGPGLLQAAWIRPRVINVSGTVIWLHDYNRARPSSTRDPYMA